MVNAQEHLFLSHLRRLEFDSSNSAAQRRALDTRPSVYSRGGKGLFGSCN